MDVLTSTEFRKRYATLHAPTKVTVNGHVIGTWTPSLVPPGFGDQVVRSLGLDPTRMRAEFDQMPVLTNAIAGQQPERGVRAFSEFRPVPKPGRK